MKKIVVLLLLMTLSSAASAAARWHASTIKYIYPQGDGSFAVMFDVNDSYCTSIETPKRYHVGVGEHGVTAEGQKTLFASVMLAYSLGKAVQIVFDDSSPSCYINRLFIL